MTRMSATDSILYTHSTRNTTWLSTTCLANSCTESSWANQRWMFASSSFVTGYL